MTSHAPVITVSSDEERGLVRFAASGLWGEEQIREGGTRIGAAAAPFVKAGRRWSILADYSEAIVQPRETATSIRESFVMAKKMGLKSIAVVKAPALVMMQYKRLVDVVDIEFFASKYDAMNWLRKGDTTA